MSGWVLPPNDRDLTDLGHDPDLGGFQGSASHSVEFGNHRIKAWGASFWLYCVSRLLLFGYVS